MANAKSETDTRELQSLFHALVDFPKEKDKSVLIEKIKSFLPGLVNTYLADKSCK